ncbi:cAMP-binding domain of CRP or a regulatory subunit of cAMP-dependent protein kinases [Chitinophaga jiangningensis]|uniref:cAMP-binding domain of CRP or a regulatory subunit of cAMP-dependent protein kinases n=1 Tax=Chitinophaga jiangningensis TaxID=1419482 RepID=A0A1M7JYZ8_9BACT|nr:Crp/Fnr family transcriptional regulator [Chitinophaga jiangningensis]SHM58194.1 cAMP-binding domain of CRP or a regulatory subunit of cAMP-dependent protein kinases [Chitinophaga jiangningensis]
MYDTFRAHVLKYVRADEETLTSAYKYFQVKKFRKKENLLTEGQICRYNYFIVSGCVRKYFINQKGLEQTTDFAIERWWMTDIGAFISQGTTDINIQAVEPTTVLQIDRHNQQQLFREYPVMESYFRQIYQKAYAAAENRIRYLYEFSREELYLHFYRHFPDFTKRVPQYLLASFLGFTPEYLSEIKRKLES